MVQPPDTGGISATSSLSSNCVSAPAYSELQASRTVRRCVSSAGNFFNNAAQSASPPIGAGTASSTDAQPVASFSWAKKRIRIELQAKVANRSLPPANTKTQASTRLKVTLLQRRAP